MRRLKGGLQRHPIIGFTTDSPMVRFLNQVKIQGEAYPSYDQQWRTLWKAYELDYITEGLGKGYGGKLTDKGQSQIKQ
jgi:hypothetical protein